MIFGGWAVLLNLASIAVLGLLVAIILCMACWPWLKRVQGTLAPRLRMRLLWCFVAAPWFMAAITCLLFTPSFLADEGLNWPNSFAHWHHPDMFSFGSWHGMTLAVFGLWCFIRVAQGLNRQRHHHRALQSLSTLAISHRQHIDGLPLFTLDCQQPTAFTTGFWRPICFVSQGLENQLGPQHLDIVIRHELAHAKHRDNLQKVLFAALASCFLPALAKTLKQQFSLATELRADQDACIRHDPLDVAQALLKVSRLQLSGHSPLQASFFGNDAITSRIGQLINPATTRALPVYRVGGLAAMLVLLPGTAVDSLHHLIEYLFAH